MTDFFRFPHTPHIAWLAEGEPRDDKVFTPAEAKALLAAEVVVEEKLDGANLGFSLGPEGDLQAQNRGQYLAAPHAGQFSRLPAWLAQHEDDITAVLTYIPQVSETIWHELFFRFFDEMHVRRLQVILLLGIVEV